MAKKVLRFDVIENTDPFDQYPFDSRQSGQKARGEELGIERVFGWRYIGSSTTDHIPAYVKKAIESAGWNVYCLGGTTYKYSTLGLKRKTSEEVLEAVRQAYAAFPDTPELADWQKEACVAAGLEILDGKHGGDAADAILATYGAFLEHEHEPDSADLRTSWLEEYLQADEASWHEFGVVSYVTPDNRQYAEGWRAGGAVEAHVAHLADAIAHAVVASDDRPLWVDDVVEAAKEAEREYRRSIE